MSAEIRTLQEQISQVKDRLKKQSEKHKKLYRGLRYIVFGLTASSTILAALSCVVDKLYGPVFSILIVAATATIGVVTSIEGLRKPGELWLHERCLYLSILDLEREIDYELSKQKDIDIDIDKYFHRMQSILDNSKDKWLNSIIQKEKDNNGNMNDKGGNSNK